MQFWTKTALMAVVGGVVAFFAAPAEAQRTGDHIVPSIETVCDGDPFSFGLCNAYCEALDCESATPLGTPRACSNLLRNYKKKSGGAIPPCGCPCQFTVQADLEFLAEELEADPGGPLVSPPIVITEETVVQTCGAVGPQGEPGYEAQAFGEPPGDGTEGVRLFYWIEPGDADAEGYCVKEGGGLDGLTDDDFDWAYGPYSPLTAAESRVPLASEGEVAACEAVLDFLCTDL